MGSILHPQLQRLLDEFYQSGFHYCWRCSFLQGLTNEAFETMIAHFAKQLSPLWHVVIEALAGKAVHIDPGETAIAYRDERYSLLIVGMSTDPAGAAEIARCGSMGSRMSERKWTPV